MSAARTWVDRGGTFTDVITWRPGAPPEARKVPSDAAVVGELARGDLVFGTTVATNALLERAVVPTLLITSEGFGDLPRIRHMARPALFDPDARWPDPLCVRVMEVPGRLGADGRELEPLRLPDAPPLDGIASVAVVLLHSGVEPAHELAVAEWIREHAPDLPISLGHRVSPEVGLLGRVETTLVDAAVTPVLSRAITRDRIPPDARAMRSDGGLTPAHALRAPDAVLSGPAGGVLAVADIARRAGLPGAVGLDMGGTSTDVCCVVGERLPRRVGDVLVAEVAVRRDMLEVETIAAGGGSVCWHDGIRLRVGPRSAGADPGPQCYGRGGPPTLTDAALAAGLVRAEAFSPPLRRDAVDLPGAPEEFLDVAREAMAGAIRRIASARGIDVRELGLVGYGGAAGQHAAHVAERLGIRTVLFHPFAAVLSAWGQTLARETTTAVEAVWAPLQEVWPGLPERVVRLRHAQGAGEEEIVLDLRVEGTDTPLPVPLAPSLAEQLEAFHTLHEQERGLDRRGEAVELVNLRVRTVRPRQDIPEPAADPWNLGARTVRGPARVDAPTTSIHVPDGWEASVREGLLTLTRSEPPPRVEATSRSAVGVSLWSSRFQAVAEQAGERLARLARSVNIRERRDFSCALFDGRGRLVANAPHIPVHLGAMGETVRDLIRHEPDAPEGSAWLTNAPDAGGSHLPDLTVVSPVDVDGERFFVASRGHHVDVGGLTPGSMPPNSQSLRDEGLVFRRVPLLRDGRLRDLSTELSGCRQPETVAADLQAQIAANRAMADGLRRLAPGAVLAAWMAHLEDAAEEAVARVIERLTDGRAEDRVGGCRLAVEVRRRGKALTVDLSGTTGPHEGNLNAPPAVVRAALLYVLRVLAGDDVPLNEGALRPVSLVLPRPSLVAPPAGAAVVGGNVETSQRLVDLLFRALGVRAASQGTMNNLTLGGPSWSFYETLGGGQGASPDGPGASACQVHMTNTRATDPEVLEHRLPLRVTRLALRHGSGGGGRHAGGDGLVRELLLPDGGTAALLATRRDAGAPGLAGGGAGAAGRDALDRGRGWEAWDGAPVQLPPGARVRVETPGGGGWGASG